MRQFAFVLRLRKCLAGSQQVAAFQQQEIEFIYRIVELSIIYPKPCWSTGVCENSSSFCSGRNEMAIIASGIRRRHQWPTRDMCVGALSEERTYYVLQRHMNVDASLVIEPRRRE